MLLKSKLRPPSPLPPQRSGDSTPECKKSRTQGFVSSQLPGGGLSSRRSRTSAFLILPPAACLLRLHSGQVWLGSGGSFRFTKAHLCTRGSILGMACWEYWRSKTLARAHEVVVPSQKNQAKTISGCYSTFLQVFNSWNEGLREKFAFEYTPGSRALAEILPEVRSRLWNTYLVFSSQGNWFHLQQRMETFKPESTLKNRKGMVKAIGIFMDLIDI